MCKEHIFVSGGSGELHRGGALILRFSPFVRGGGFSETRFTTSFNWSQLSESGNCFPIRAVPLKIAREGRPPSPEKIWGGGLPKKIWGQGGHILGGCLPPWAFFNETALRGARPVIDPPLFIMLILIGAPRVILLSEGLQQEVWSNDMEASRFWSTLVHTAGFTGNKYC